ncbi:MAG: hypothetical protein AAFV49_18945 [Pseudomonadota bacterium]
MADSFDFRATGRPAPADGSLDPPSNALESSGPNDGAEAEPLVGRFQGALTNGDHLRLPAVSNDAEDVFVF